jgi:hypothetical protein
MQHALNEQLAVKLTWADEIIAPSKKASPPNDNDNSVGRFALKGRKLRAFELNGREKSWPARH